MWLTRIVELEDWRDYCRVPPYPDIRGPDPVPMPSLSRRAPSDELRVGKKPESSSAHWFLGFALIGAERFDEAITTLERAASLSDRSSAVLGVLVRAYAGAGRRAEALRVLGELQQRRQRGYVPPAAFLNAYLGLGDKEEAFAWMERAAEERSNIMQFLKVHPFFDSIRGDPRFAEFLLRANFSPKQLVAAPT